MNLSWSKPYCGVQHLKGHPSLDGLNGHPRTHQISLAAYSTFVECSVLALASAHPFTAWKKETFNTIADAMAWGEEQARNL